MKTPKPKGKLHISAAGREPGIRYYIAFRDAPGGPILAYWPILYRDLITAIGAWTSSRKRVGTPYPHTSIMEIEITEPRS